MSIHPIRSWLVDSPLSHARNLWREHTMGKPGQTLVYVAIGSHSPDPKPDNEHQECPLWLRQFHDENPKVPIRITLIDPAYKKGVPNLPFQLSSIEQTPYGRILVASGEPGSDIQVMVVPHSIDMDRSPVNSFNIIDLATELSHVCVVEPDRFMIVIDAFTGHNLYMHRPYVPIAIPATVLVGGEHDRDSGCFRDFSQPGTCPLIIPDPNNDGRFMFLTPENVGDEVRYRVMHLTPTTSPSSRPLPTFVELSLRRWIDGECRQLRTIISGELLLFLRMFAKIARNIEIADSLDNIGRSLERCKKHRITAQGPQDIYDHMRRLITLIAQKYAKNTREFKTEIDMLIATLASEPDIHKFGIHVNQFFDTYFPRYPFAPI